MLGCYVMGPFVMSPFVMGSLVMGPYVRAPFRAASMSVLSRLYRYLIMSVDGGDVAVIALAVLVIGRRTR